nr:hypothetical protein [Tanacetum cinerariifolium]
MSVWGVDNHVMDYIVIHPLTCCEYKGPLKGGFCLFCNSRAENSFTYDPNPYSFNDTSNVFTYPPQPHNETYLCELCGNNSHYGYDCPPHYGGPHATFQCQPMNQNINSFGFTKFNPRKSDKEIKSSVKNLVPIPSESEVTSDNESECDVPVCDDFTTISNPLFDCNNDFTSSDKKSLSNEDVPMENFKIYSNPFVDDEEIISSKIDLHHEFSGELAHIDPIPPGIEEADFDLEEEIRLVENLLYDNSSPRPPEEFNAEIVVTVVESLSPSHIPVEDSNSQIEEINLFLTTGDLRPPSIENDDFDSEGDIHFLEELLSNDTLTLPENKSSNFDHDNSLFPRPPWEPPDVKIFFDFEPDTGVLTTKVMKDISEHHVLMPKVLPS